MPATHSYIHSDRSQLQSRVDHLMLALDSERNQAALHYWHGLSDGGRLPQKCDIDPANMMSFLGNIVLLDVCHDPIDFRYRLIGGTVRYHLHDDLTGQWMRDVPHNAPPSTIHAALSDVVTSRLPASTHTPYIGPRSLFMTLEDIVMPLIAEDGCIDHLLVSVDFFSMKGQIQDGSVDPDC